MHYIEKMHAREELAFAFKKAGWEVSGLRPTESDGMTDYYSPGNWNGTATNPAFPDYAVVCGHPDNYPEVPKGKMWYVYCHGRILFSGQGFTALKKDYYNLHPDATKTDASTELVNDITKRISEHMSRSSRMTGEATPKQLYYIHLLTHQDTRGWKISKEEASAMIEKLKRGEEPDFPI
jgi:hypothetical protein